LYNIPGRCATNIDAATILRLAALPNIVAVKEASGSLQQAADVLSMAAEKFPHFKLFAGDDALALPMMALGAAGVVSVVSNLVPSLMVALINAACAGDFSLARQLQYQLLPLYKAAFLETNPAPIKRAMQLCGRAAGECRLPLVELSLENLERLRQTLLHMQLIST
jgi:4-hydroxy-tetrahydrodipicolinate synthase